MKVLVQTPNKNNARIIGKESFVTNDGSAQSQYISIIVHIICQDLNRDLLTQPDFLNSIK
jgi:hypothetical protein